MKIFLIFSIPIFFISAIVYLIIDLQTNSQSNEKFIENSKELESELSKISQYEKKHIPENQLKSILNLSNNNPSIAETAIKSLNQGKLNQLEILELKKIIAKDTDKFNEEMANQYSLALENKNIDDQITILNTAAFYSHGNLKLINEAEKIILETTEGQRKFNLTLFKSALNYYLIQVELSGEDVEKRKQELLANCQNDHLKSQILTEFNHFKPSKGMFYESH